MRPLVTIVTPTFRMADRLETAIRSVGLQDYDRIEYLVVDGGDDAETPAVVARFPQVVTRYVREADRGQSDAINKGFRAAKGEIVAWVNADDYYFPDAVSRAVRAFERDPSLDLFYGDAVYTDRDGQFLRYFTEVERPDLDRIRSFGDYICQPTTFFKRSTLERVGLPDDRLHFTMDWDLWCRMAAAGCRFHYEEAPIAVNREYADTKTMAGGLPRVRELLETNWRYKTRLVPWAFLAMARVELPRAVPWLRHGARLWGPVMRAKRALFGRAPVRPLYGLHAHTNDACQDARVSVPVPEGAASWVEVELGVADGLARQDVSVSVGGRELGWVELRGAPRRERFELVDRTPSGRLDVDLRAREPANGAGAAFQLLRIRHGAA